MRCQPYNRPASRRGAAEVELAVILPVLVLLFVVAVDYARVFHYALTVANCARNGALYGRDTASAAESPFTSIKDRPSPMLPACSPLRPFRPRPALTRRVSSTLKLL